MKNLKFGMFALLIGMFASCDSHDDAAVSYVILLTMLKAGVDIESSVALQKK